MRKTTEITTIPITTPILNRIPLINITMNKNYRDFVQ